MAHFQNRFKTLREGPWYSPARGIQVRNCSIAPLVWHQGILAHNSLAKRLRWNTLPSTRDSYAGKGHSDIWFLNAIIYSYRPKKIIPVWQFTKTSGSNGKGLEVSFVNSDPKIRNGAVLSVQINICMWRPRIRRKIGALSPGLAETPKENQHSGVSLGSLYPNLDH